MNLNKEQKEQIAELRSQQYQTIRPVSAELEKELYKIHPVLDRGFVRVMDYMGNDSSIVQAARVSYGKGTKKLNADKGLINYLMAHQHSTPFEMCEIKFHIKLPIFIARQWIRHRTASVNEYSARYSIMEDEFYIPKHEHLAPQSKINHQGRNENETLDVEESKKILAILKKESMDAYENYLYMANIKKDGSTLNENQTGIARELARINLPLNLYTQWYWKIDLHNLFHFLKLRADSHAQYEIRAYAKIMLDMVKKWVPFAYEAFIKNQFSGKMLSGKALEIIKKKLKGQKITYEESGLSKREWEELQDVLEINL